MKNYQIIRSARKTIAIQITPAGEVIVRCPRRMRSEDVEAFVKSKSAWIEKHLRNLAEKPNDPPFTEEELRSFSTRTAQIIQNRVEYYSALMGTSPGDIRVRRQRSRWGSCSGKGNLNFNCLLCLTPPEVLDYVVIHELCHLKQMNHSPAFWAEVEKVLPDYRVHRAWLKEHGGELIRRLP